MTAKEWFYSLDWGERNRLSLKHRNTYAYGVFSDQTFEEIMSKEVKTEIEKI